MNIHKNARTTVHGRLLMVQRVIEAKQSVASVAAELGTSESTVYKWLRRWRSGGASALQDRRSTPLRRRGTVAQTISEIERLRRERLSSPAIARQLGMPVSTVTDILRRLGLNRLKMLEPPAPANRYERATPGELLHFDIKKLGRIAGIGHRITGRRTGAINRHRGIGWDHLHVCIDDASRLAYTEIMPDDRKESAVAFLHRALAWFDQLGISVQRVMTDNGNCYRSHAFRLACADAGLRHLRTKPYTPRTNGKAERFIQTSLREWAYARPYESSQDRTAALEHWIEHYNTVRPHMALANRAPLIRLQAPLLGSTEGTVASSRPIFHDERPAGPGQGAPKATGDSRRAASLPRPDAALTLSKEGTLCRQL